MTNMDKLYASVAANGPVCVGLDTEFSYLPADVVDDTKTAGENVVEFNRRIIESQLYGISIFRNRDITCTCAHHTSLKAS